MSTDQPSFEDIWAPVAAARVRCLDDARGAATEKQHRRGMMTARERIAALIDEGSFIEYGMLVTPADASIDGPADGMVTGIGKMNGHPVAIISYDFTVAGGSQGSRGHQKQDRLCHAAEDLNCPVIALIEGGGGRASESSEGSGGGLSDFVNMARMSGRLPLVAAVFGRAFAGHAALAGLCDVVIARRSAALGMAGPPLVAAATGQQLTAEEIGAADMHYAAGGIDILVDDDAAALAAIRSYLAHFTRPVEPSADAVEADAGIRDLVPINARRAYDMRKVVTRLCDPGSEVALRGGFAKNILTSLGRIGGVSVGILANQPMQLGGAIDSDGSDKAARFVELCDAFRIPLVSLVDTPGFMVGPQAERQALLRHSSRLVAAMSRFRSPMVSILVRKAFGLAYFAMGARTFNPVLHVAWPTAQFGAMGLEGAARLMAGRDASDERIATIVEDLRGKGTPMHLAERGRIDDVIDPADTRRLVAQVLSYLPDRPHPDGSRPVPAW